MKRWLIGDIFKGIKAVGNMISSPLSHFLWLCWLLAQQLVWPAEMSPYMNEIKT